MKRVKISDSYTSCTDVSIEQTMEHIRMLIEEGCIGEKWTFELIEMSDEEFESIGEFTGW